jgi:hypothetical protein
MSAAWINREAHGINTDRSLHPLNCRLTILALVAACEPRSPISVSSQSVGIAVEGGPPPALRVPRGYSNPVKTETLGMPVFSTRSEFEDYLTVLNSSSSSLVLLGQPLSSELVDSQWSVRGPHYQTEMYDLTLTVKQVLKGTSPGVLIRVFSPPVAEIPIDDALAYWFLTVTGDGRLEVAARRPYDAQAARRVEALIESAPAAAGGRPQ